MDSIRSTTSKKGPQYLVTFCTTLGALAAGANLAWSSPAMPKLQKSNEYSFVISETDLSWISSLLPLGAAFAALPFPVMVANCGRKDSMHCLIVPSLVGWILIHFAVNVQMMCWGRFFVGLFVGGYFIGAPPYIGEIADKDVRGKLGSCFQLMIVLGIFVVYSAGPYLSLTELNYLCKIITFVFFIALIFMPESPTYYVTKDKDAKAVQSILWLRGKNFNYDAELEETKTECDRQKLIKAKSLVFEKANRRALIIGMGLMFFQQATGINIMIYYTTDIFTKAQVNMDPNTATIIFGAVQVLATAIQSFIVDKVGRKLLLFISETGLCLSNLALAAYFFSGAKEFNWIPVAVLSFYIVLFAFGMGPVPFVIIGEVYGMKMKNIATSACSMFKWIVTFLVTKSFYMLYDAMGISATFLLYSVLTFIGIIFIYFLIPETKGKTLPEIQMLLLQ